MLTFVAAIDLRLANEGRTVDLVAPQEDIGWVGVAPSNVRLDTSASSAIVTLLVAATTASEEVRKLHRKSWLINVGN